MKLCHETFAVTGVDDVYPNCFLALESQVLPEGERSSTPSFYEVLYSLYSNKLRPYNVCPSKYMDWSCRLVLAKISW